MKRLSLFGLPLLFAIFILSGCSIQLSNSKGQDGGIFRSQDFGVTWVQKAFVRKEKNRTVEISNVDISSITVSPFQPAEIVITTYANGIFRTTNSGDAWEALPLPAGNYPVFTYDPTNEAILYSATGRTIVKSGDSGKTWNTIYTDPRGEIITALAVDRYDASKIYAGTNGGTILKSVNFGNDWAVKRSIADPIRTMFFRSDDTRILYVVSTNKGLQRSPDGGETWVDLAPTTVKFANANIVSQVTFSPNAPRTLYMASNYGLLKSIDGGDTWTAIKTLIPENTIPIRTVGVDPLNANSLYFTENNILQKSEDAGTTWKTITLPTGRLVTRLVVHPSTAGLLYFGTIKVKK